MPLLGGGLADIKLPGLAVVIGKGGRTHPLLFALHGLGVTGKAFFRAFPWAALLAPAVWFIVGAALGVVHGHMAILLKMPHRALGGVNGNMSKVRPAQTLELGIEVGKIAALQQRVFRLIDTAHDILGAKGHLLGLGKKVVHHPIQHQTPDDAHRHQLFGNQFGGVQHIEFKALGKVLVKHLQAQLPLREITATDGIPQIATVEIRVGAIELYCLVPHHGLHPLPGFPVKFDKNRRALAVDHAKGVHTEAFHKTQGAGNRPV